MLFGSFSLDAVGVSAGAGVGSGVGYSVGAGVGSGVGCSVGAAVGSEAADNVGLTVGSTVETGNLTAGEADSSVCVSGAMLLSPVE